MIDMKQLSFERNSIMRINMEGIL